MLKLVYEQLTWDTEYFIARDEEYNAYLDFVDDLLLGSFNVASVYDTNDIAEIPLHVSQSCPQHSLPSTACIAILIVC